MEGRFDEKTIVVTGAGQGRDFIHFIPRLFTFTEAEELCYEVLAYDISNQTVDR